MKTIMSYFKVALAVIMLGQLFGTAADVNLYIKSGRSAMEQGNLPAAKQYFQQAVNLSTNHQEANVLLGITRLAAVADHPVTSNLLNRLAFSREGRSIHHWRSAPSKDTNGTPIIPDGVNAEEILQFLNETLLPEIMESKSCFERVTNVNIIVRLSIGETKLAGAIIDYADIQLIRAMLCGVMYGIYVADSQNLDAQVKALVDLIYTGSPTAEDMLKNHPALFTFKKRENMIKAKAALQEGCQLYNTASDLIRARPSTMIRLFNLDDRTIRGEGMFRNTINDIVASMDRTVTIRKKPYLSVNTSRLYSNMVDLRLYFPEFESNNVVANTLRDTTFGGIISGLSSEKIEEYVEKNTEITPKVEIKPADIPRKGKLEIYGKKNHTYILESSKYLKEWDLRYSVPGGRHVITVDMSDSARFYRLLSTASNTIPPMNDNFSNRIKLSGNYIREAGTLLNSTIETNEYTLWLGINRSVWYTWVAPETGQYAIRAGQYRPYIGVYQGTNLANLTLLQWTWIGFPLLNAVKDEEYVLQISGDDYTPDLFQLCIAKPWEIQFVEAGGISNNGTYMAPLQFTYRPVLKEGSAPLKEFRIRKFPGIYEPLSVWPKQDTCVINEVGSHPLIVEVEDELGNVTSMPWFSININLTNDNFNQKIKLTGNRIYRNDIFSRPSREPWEPNHGREYSNYSTWYSWVPAYSGPATIMAKYSYGSKDKPIIAVYTGLSMINLQQVAISEAGHPEDDVSRAGITVRSNQNYQIALAGDNNINGKVKLYIIPTAPPAIELTEIKFVSSNSLKITANAYDADGSIREVIFQVEKTVLQSMESGPYEFTWNDVRWKYWWIKVTAFDNENVSACAFIDVNHGNNDRYPNWLEGEKVYVIGFNRDATKDPGEAFHAGNVGGKSVWWKWMAPFTGQVSISSRGSDFDTLLAVYWNHASIAEDDDSGGELTSATTFYATKGHIYDIVVDGYNGASGNIVLTIKPE